MKIPELPDNVRVHPNVEREIKEIAVSDKNKAGRIIQRIAELGLDPENMTEECESVVIHNLRKQKIPVRRLKCLDILDYRIFYALRKSGLVCVYCVVQRDSDTYAEDSYHYNIVKLLYKFWGECQ